MKVRRPSTSTSRKQALQLSQSILKSSQPSSTEPTPTPQPQIKTFPHSTPPKTYRINEQDVYNYIRNSVFQTFEQKTSRNYELVKELTDHSVPGQKDVIDRLCKKYSILRKNRLSFFQNAQVNVEEITNRYVKSRGKEKQKEEEKARLKMDIQVNYRYGRNKEYEKTEEFFSFQGNDLKILERRFKQKQRIRSFQNRAETKSCSQDEKPKSKEKPKQKAHPYLQLYEQAQKQAMNSVINHQKIDLIPEYPSLFEPQQWQRNKKSIQKMVEQSKPKRVRQVQSARARLEKPTKPDFYLT